MKFVDIYEIAGELFSIHCFASNKVSHFHKAVDNNKDMPIGDTFIATVRER